MPQNWWEFFPEIPPSSAARRRPLPGPGGAMPGPAIGRQPAFPYGAPEQEQAPPGAFDPTYFSGDMIADRDPARTPFSGDDGASAMDRIAAIQHAAAAIRRGADPNAVRARLGQMGVSVDDLDPLAGGGAAQAQAWHEADHFQAPPGMWAHDQAPQDLGGLKTSLFPDVHAPDRVVNLRHQASAVETAPLKRGYPYQAKGGLPPARQSSGHHPLVFTSSRSGKPPPPPADVNGYGYVPAPDDVNLLARTLYAEFSTVNNWRDMPAGAWSILNRIRPHGRWPRYRTIDTIGTSLLDVLNKRTRDGTPQYSFVPPGGIGAAGGSERWQESAHPQTLTGSAQQAWMLAVDTARRVLGGGVADPTEGATHFFNVSHGTPERVGGFFYAATRGPRPTLTYSPYRSPTGQNFFLRTIEDGSRPVPWTAVRHNLRYAPRRNR